MRPSNGKTKIISALTYVPPNDRQLWITIGMALKSELSEEEGFDVWSEWSQRDDSYNERDAKTAWRGFKPSGKVTIATLYYHAKTNGWKDNNPDYKIATEQIQKLNADRFMKAEVQRAKDEVKHRTTAQQAQAIYNAADSTDDNHPYLISKGIGADRHFKTYRGKLIVDGRKADGAMIVAVGDQDGISGLEFIWSDGTKRPLGGGSYRGKYFQFGDNPTDRLIVCEGVATGKSIYDATGIPTFCARSCTNLAAVAIVLNERFPVTSILICGDIGNGEQSALNAAQAAGAKLVLPKFNDETSDLTDFNDLHNCTDLETVKSQIESAFNSTRPNIEVSENVKNFDDAVAELARLSPDRYDRVRKAESAKLGVQLKTLDSAVKELRSGTQESSDAPFDEIVPWPEPIHPAELLSDIAATIRRFIICDAETCHAAALWAAMTWFMDAIQVAPLAVITAPEKRCGKSQLLFLLARTTCKPLPASNITPAALFRSIDRWQPTLLIDEADAFMRENEELRGLLNCGHTRESAFSIRTVGEDHTPTRFNLWGAKALAGIGHLADTLMDRAITLELRRKMPSENVDKLRYAEPELFSVICRKLARFGMDYADRIKFARPALPDVLHDRAQDNWEPLLAIADVAGGAWPEQARQAAIKLSGEVIQGHSHGSELLSDIKEIFEQKKATRIFSDDLTNALCNDSEKSWSTYNRGKPITPKQLAKKLRDYSIVSKSLRIDIYNKKGYDLSQFQDAFSRYLADASKIDDFPVTTSQANNHAGLAVTIANVTDVSVTPIGTRKPNGHAGCDDVTAKNGDLGGSERTLATQTLTVDI